MIIPPPDEITAINESMRKLSRREAIAFLRSAFASFKPQRFIRDFALMQCNQPGIDCEVIIFHLPTMLWQGFHMSYQDASTMLRECPEQDHELIYEIVVGGHQASKDNEH